MRSHMNLTNSLKKKVICRFENTTKKKTEHISSQFFQGHSEELQ